MPCINRQQVGVSTRHMASQKHPSSSTMHHASRITHHHTSLHITVWRALVAARSRPRWCPIKCDGEVGRVCIFILTNDATTSETNNVMIAVSL